MLWVKSTANCSAYLRSPRSVLLINLMSCSVASTQCHRSHWWWLLDGARYLILKTIWFLNDWDDNPAQVISSLENVYIHLLFRIGRFSPTSTTAPGSSFRIGSPNLQIAKHTCSSPSITSILHRRNNYIEGLRKGSFWMGKLRHFRTIYIRTPVNLRLWTTSKTSFHGISVSPFRKS